MPSPYRHMWIRQLFPAAFLVYGAGLGSREAGVEGWPRTVSTVATISGMVMFLVAAGLNHWLSGQPKTDLSYAPAVPWPQGGAVAVRRASRRGWEDIVLLGLSVLVTWWFIYVGVDWYYLAISTTIALFTLIPLLTTILVEPRLGPVLTMDRDGLHEPTTWVRIAWRDVVTVWAYQAPGGEATLFLKLGDPERAATEAGGHRRGRRAADTIREKGGFEFVISDRNLSPETIVGLVRTAIAVPFSTDGVARV